MAPNSANSWPGHGDLVPDAVDGEVSREAMRRSRAHILWSNPGNPSDSVARALGMAARRFRRALHKIKAANDLSGRIAWSCRSCSTRCRATIAGPPSSAISWSARVRRAHVTCFWRGDPGEPAPEVPDCVKSTIHPLATAIETDFAVAGSRRTGGLKWRDARHHRRWNSIRLLLSADPTGWGHAIGVRGAASRSDAIFSALLQLLQARRELPQR